MALIPVHEVRNEDKLESLKASMTENGWTGADLVADGDQLLTGSHRYAAWVGIGNDPEELPVIDIRDIFISGTSWDELMEDGGHDTEWALSRYPQGVQHRYGFDTNTCSGDDSWMEA